MNATEVRERKLISILVPIYNEAPLVDALYDRLTTLAAALPRYDFELLFVDDGSSDGTLDAIKALADTDDRIEYLRLSRNFGQETAIMAGIDHVSGDAMVIVDADLQDPPEIVIEMVRSWEEGYEDVYGRRRSRQDSGLRRAAASVYYRLLQGTASIHTQPGAGYFRLLDRRAVLALREIRERNRYLRGMMSWIGFRKKEILYDRDPRTVGRSKWRFGHLLTLAVNGLTSSTTKPLRLATLMGAIVSVCAFVFAIVIVIRALAGDDALLAGWASTMAVILFLGGVQLLCLGVIGEYIARIFVETKGRPLYVLGETRVREGRSDE